VIGTTIGRYKLVETLGSGGMGVVFRATDAKLGRDVALKLLPPEIVGDAEARARLEREARIASQLAHPGICTVFDVGESEGRTYLAMELIQGQTLGNLIPPNGMPVQRLVRLGVEIADALSHAHARGVVHRDLKPSNVMLNDQDHVKLLDFGLARHATGTRGVDARSSKITQTGTLVGTPAYLPPEVLQGAPAEAPGDLWALGVLLHEMATGSPPFHGRTEFELAAAIVHGAPAPLPANLPGDLREVIARCMVKDPLQRFGRAEDVRAALEAVGPETMSSRLLAERSTSPGVRKALRPIGRATRRFWVPALILAAIVMASLLTLDVKGLRRRMLGGRPSPNIRSIAVLPLENLAHDPAEDYFADGMTDELITRLGRLEGMRVVSRTSTMRLKGTRKPLRQIGRELGVQAVIDGSALRAGDKVRITAELVDVAADRQLWAKSYEHDLRDVLALQAELANAIASEIETRLAPGSQAVAMRRIDSRAYEAYLKGRYYWNKRTERDLLAGIDWTTRSIGLDSSFAPAYAALGSEYVVLPSHSARSVAECMPRAREAAMRALALDPQQAEAHAVLGAVALNERNWAGGESEYRRSIALDANYATAHQWYGEFLSMLGRHDEAIAESRKAQQLDPISIPVHSALAARYVAAGRLPEAITAWTELIQLDPSSPSHFYDLADTYLASARFTDAIAAFARGDSLAGVTDQYAKDLANALAAGGVQGFWRKFLSIAMKPPPASPLEIAGIYAQLDERDKAFEWLNRVAKANDNKSVLWLGVDWKLAPLRSDPRFAALVHRVGLSR